MVERMSMLRRVEVLVLEEPMRLFRIAPERDAASFEDAFRSPASSAGRPGGAEYRTAGINDAEPWSMT